MIGPVRRALFASALIGATLFATTQSLSAQTDSGPRDADTRAWWSITGELSGDSMEGRDTGSPGYDRAAQWVADRFKAAGLTPLGMDGGWFQPVVMDEVAVTAAELTTGGHTLRFLHDYTVSPSAAMPTKLDAPMVYGGYCSAAVLGDVRGKLVICHGVNRPGLPGGQQREDVVKAAGGIGIITIADPGFTVEPPRWPFAYARTLTLAGKPTSADAFLRLRLNADALARLIGNSGHDAADLIARGSSGASLPSFAVPVPLDAAFTLTQKKVTSSNVLAMLPGTDPALADQAIVLSAHLDGYGYGEAVGGDTLYNGTLDDAAYVALLVHLAQQRGGKGFRRPVIFAAFAAEEKGIFGSIAFLAKPTHPLPSIAANINLDQLRPIFPLDLLTVHAMDDTTLGDDARAVAAEMGIAVQHDPEPERNLVRRSDQWNFIQAGIPATAFVFGYRPGSESERIYRQWYKVGYHKPQDDMHQPMNWKAAADFNRFFYKLVDRVANQDASPAWKEGSKLRPMVAAVAVPLP